MSKIKHVKMKTKQKEKALKTEQLRETTIQVDMIFVSICNSDYQALRNGLKSSFKGLEWLSLNFVPRAGRQ
jgi:hypothetical protein